MPLLMIPLVYGLAGVGLAFGLRMGNQLADVVLDTENKEATKKTMADVVTDYYKNRSRSEAVVVE